jgi:hypothetical protein
LTIANTMHAAMLRIAIASGHLTNQQNPAPNGNAASPVNDLAWRCLPRHRENSGATNNPCPV